MIHCIAWWKCIFAFPISWVRVRNCKVNCNLQTFKKRQTRKCCRPLQLSFDGIFNDLLFPLLPQLNWTTKHSTKQGQRTQSLNALLNLTYSDTMQIRSRRDDRRLRVALHVMLTTIKRMKECSRTSPSLRVSCPRHGNLVLFIICVFAFGFLFVWDALLLC